MPEPLTQQQVLHVARLARLGVVPAEMDRYVTELSAILALVDQLQLVDTAGTAPMAHPLDQVLRLRADEVTETDRRELYQGNAPAVDRGLYLVPRVIE